MKDFQLDAANLARNGYVVASQVQTSGGRTPAASLFIVLGVSCLVLGFFFLPLWAIAIVCLVIGLVSGKSPGELAVVWKYAGRAEVAAPEAPIAQTPPASDPLATLSALAGLRDQGAITAEEFDAKKADLLGRL